MPCVDDHTVLEPPAAAGALERVVYASRLVRPPGTTLDAVIDGIVAQSRRNNPDRGITGALVCGEGRCAQVLEGKAPALDRLLAAIAADPRHTEMTILERGPAGPRLFGAWSMAFLDDLELLPPDLLEAEDPGSAGLGLVLRLAARLRATAPVG